MVPKRKNPPTRDSGSHSQLVELVRENGHVNLHFTDPILQERFQRRSAKSFWPNRHIDHGVLAYLGIDEEMTQLIHNSR
jgi:hypothetical protein